MNNSHVKTDENPAITLLDFIRYKKSLTGTKIGCREGDCGACTVLVGRLGNDEVVYSSATSCLMPLGNAHHSHIVTIEGLNLEGKLNKAQECFAKEGATQCGFCTPGFIVSLCGHSLSPKSSSPAAAIDSMNGNICRCTGYKSIERAAVSFDTLLQKRTNESATDFAIRNEMVPAYFSKIKLQLSQFSSNGITKNISGRKVAGGTDLYVQLHDTITEEDVQLLAHDTSLKYIQQKGDMCEFGGGVTVADIAASKVFQNHFHDLPKLVRLISSTQIRNMATVAGNFVNASPIGDLTIFFLALDAKLILSNGKTERQVALRSFYKGYKILDKTPDEYIRSVFFRLPSANQKFNFEKVSKRTHLDIASVNSACFISVSASGNVEEVALSAGGVAPFPLYLSQTSEFLTNKKFDDEVIKEAMEIAAAEVTPISDARGSAEYKKLLLSQLVKAHFLTFFENPETQVLS